MVDTQSGAFSTPKLHELNTLMEKRRSELKQLKEGRLKATHLVRIARNSFSLGDGGTPAAVRTQTGLSTPFYNASGSRGQVGMLYRRSVGVWFMFPSGRNLFTTTDHGLIDGNVLFASIRLVSQPPPPPRVLGY